MIHRKHTLPPHAYTQYYMHMHMHMHAVMPTCVHRYVRAHTHIHKICVYIYINKFFVENICIHMYTHTHTYIYIYIFYVYARRHITDTYVQSCMQAMIQTEQYKSSRFRGVRKGIFRSVPGKTQLSCCSRAASWAQFHMCRGGRSE